MSDRTKDQVVASAAATLALTTHGRPQCPDSSRIFAAITAVELVGDPQVTDELLTGGFFRHSDERRCQWVEDQFAHITGDTFEMGTSESNRRHFCGETPAHTVTLSSFLLSQTALTTETYALYDGRRTPDRASRQLPVTQITWFDAWVFAAWMGCRLPTEAEWEYCCGAGTEGELCCSLEQLPEYAWYSETAMGELHQVGGRHPNVLGLYDMHGNVWEWCEDTYSDGFYARSDAFNPVNRAVDRTVAQTHKVSRGGGYLALAEMCRNRYRLHDPAEYSAPDCGMRLASTTHR